MSPPWDDLYLSSHIGGEQSVWRGRNSVWKDRGVHLFPLHPAALYGVSEQACWAQRVVKRAKRACCQVSSPWGGRTGTGTRGADGTFEFELRQGLAAPFASPAERKEKAKKYPWNETYNKLLGMRWWQKLSGPQSIYRQLLINHSEFNSAFHSLLLCQCTVAFINTCSITYPKRLKSSLISGACWLHIGDKYKACLYFREREEDLFSFHLFKCTFPWQKHKPSSVMFPFLFISICWGCPCLFFNYFSPLS